MNAHRRIPSRRIAFLLAAGNRLVACLLCGAAFTSRLQAQNPVQRVFTACTTSGDVYTERQVQAAARFIGDSTRSPRPARARPTSPNVIGFVTDTLGVPERGSFSPVRAADSELVRRAAQEYTRWRFTPAMATGCRVRQLVVVALQE